MAVYKQGAEPWKLFEGYAQAGKSGDILIEDINNENPVLLVDWSTGKYRNTDGNYDIVQTFAEELNTASYLLTKGAIVYSIGNDVHEIWPADPTKSLADVWKTTIAGGYQYISFWFKVRSGYFNNNNDGHVILSFEAGDQKFSVYFDADSNSGETGQVGFSWVDGAVVLDLQTVLANGVSVGDWHHVVFKNNLSSDLVRDVYISSGIQSGDVEVFIDGQRCIVTSNSYNGVDIYHDNVEPSWGLGGLGGIGTATLGFGFDGSLGNLSILSSPRTDLCNTIYRLERWGASKLHSGIHSFGERIQKDQLDKRVIYPSHFGGLTATNTGLGTDSFTDTLDTSWNDERPVGSYVYSEQAIPFLGLDGSDPLAQNWRSETKSLFFSEDLTDFEVQGSTSSQELYKSIDTSQTDALVFDDTLRVGEPSDTEFKDRIVIDIPLSQTQSCTLGAGDQFNGTFGLDHEFFPPETQRHVAYYNFKDGGFEPKRDEWGIPLNFPPFSPGQGVTIDPVVGWEASIKGMARPCAGYGFPWVNVWEQDDTETLDLSGYLKDEFILEGYEIILDVEHAEAEAINHWDGFGLANKIGGMERTNDFGTPLINDGDVYDNQRKAFGTKIFTTFLLRQKPYFPDNSLLDISDPIGYQTEFSTVSNDTVGLKPFLNKDTQVSVSTYTLETVLEGEFTQSMMPFSSSRDLITYGQTVLHTKDPIISEPQSQTLVSGAGDPTWYRSGDESTNKLLDQELRLAEKSLQFTDLMADREQLVSVDWLTLASQSLQPLQINQIVPIKSISSSFTPIHVNRWVIGTSNLSMPDVRNGAKSLIDPKYFNAQVFKSMDSWAGGSDPLSLIENRANPSVVGTNKPKASETSQLVNLDVYGIDTAQFPGEIELQKEINREYRADAIFSTEPTDDSSGYILTPNDKLILGFMNSNSQHGDSFVYEIDQDGNRVGNNINLHQNTLVIPPQTGAKLRLFGRYKRNDKPVNPTPNLSLFHGKNVNEPIGSEDIRDQYQVEDITSYATGISDDIMGDDSSGIEITLGLGFEGFNNASEYPSILDNFIPDLSGSFAELKYSSQPAFYTSDTFPDAQNETFGVELSWAAFNPRIFPGLPLVDDGTGTYVSFDDNTGVVGEKIGAFLGTEPNISLGTAPELNDSYPAVLQFLTNEPKYIWNTTSISVFPFGTQDVHFRKGGVLLEELKEEGIQNPTGTLLTTIEQSITLPIFDPNTSTVSDTVFNRDAQNFETFTFSTNTAVSAWNYNFLFSVYTSDGWKPAKVRFVPVVIDVVNPPTVENGAYFLSLGSAFYFEPDDNGTWNNGDSKLISTNTSGPNWSNHLANSITDELRIFIVVAHGQPTPTSWTPYTSGTVEAWNGDSFNSLSSGNDTGTYPGLGLYHLRVGQGQSLTVQEVYEKISDIISYECGQNRSLLLARDENDLPSETFKFPLNESSLEYYGIASQALESYAASLATVEDLYSSGNVYTKSTFDNSGWISTPVLNLDTGNLEYRPNKFAEIDWSTWPVPNFSFEKEDISHNSYKGMERFFGLSRRVVARTSEPIASVDLYGELSVERDAGFLGSLRKQFVLQETGYYHDSIAKRPEGVSNTDFTTWVNVSEPLDTDLEKSLKSLHNFRTELGVSIISNYDSDAGTRSFETEGLFQRLEISNISGDLVWPDPLSTSFETLELPLKSWVSSDFPFTYEKNTDISFVLRGLGSGENGKIKVKPQASELAGWSSEGPVAVADSMIMEPLRGVRWGAMHPTALRRNHYFSIRSFGQPMDFIQSGVDGAITMEESKHASAPFNGPPVITKIFSRQNPDVEIIDTSLSDEDKLLFRYNRLSIVTEPYNDTMEVQDQISNGPLIDRKTPASVVQGLGSGDNLKVNLVNQIGKSATFTPGNIIKRIKRT